MSLEKKFFYLFVLLAGFLLVGMPILSQDFGITWDEWVHAHYGKLIWRYFLTWGTDQSCLTSGAGMGDFRLQYYGHLFDTIATGVYGVVRGSLSKAVFEEVSWDRFYETKHAVNALFGCWAMIFTGLVAKEIGGWRAGFLALVFIAATPTFFGHSMNNPKDIPFAGAYIFCLYFMIRYFKNFQTSKQKRFLGLIVSIAVAINIRIGGLLLIGYLFFFAFLYMIQNRNHWKALLRNVMLIGITGYFGGLIFWPYGHQNPFVNPFLALQEMSKYQLLLGNLFEGQTILSTQVPWYYVPRWISITAPLVVILGFIATAFVCAFRKFRLEFRIFHVGLLFFSIAFPMVYAIILKSSFYDSWRHFLFIYPPIVVLSALAFEFGIRNLPKVGKGIVGALILIMLADPIKWMIKNHPHQYVYFNQSISGLDGAFSNYDTDYWGNSLRLGAEWLGRYIKDQGIQGPVIVSADGSIVQTAYYLRRDLGDQYVPFNLDLHREHWWDYGLVLSRNWRKKDLLSGAWPPPGTIHEIKADNVTLCAVVKIIDFYRMNKEKAFQGR